jgi:tryptophan-rich sensory protein
MHPESVPVPPSNRRVLETRVSNGGPVRPGRRIADFAAPAAFIAGCLAIGGLGAWLTASTIGTWYPTLKRPPLTPPNWVFGPVWTTLYVLMGIAACLVWHKRRTSDVRSAMAAFAVQLVLNLAWSGLFFALANPGAALVEIVVLWLAIGATVAAFGRHSSTAAALMTPYWLWVSFAVYLNAGFWWLNR